MEGCPKPAASGHFFAPKARLQLMPPQRTGMWVQARRALTQCFFCEGSRLLRGSTTFGRASKEMPHLPEASRMARQCSANGAIEIKPNLLPFPLAAPGLLSAEPLRVTRGVPLPGTAPPAGAKSRDRPKLQISALGSCTGNKRSEISEVHSWNPHLDHVFVRYHVHF